MEVGTRRRQLQCTPLHARTVKRGSFLPCRQIPRQASSPQTPARSLISRCCIATSAWTGSSPRLTVPWGRFFLLLLDRPLVKLENTARGGQKQPDLKVTLLIAVQFILTARLRTMDCGRSTRDFSFLSFLLLSWCVWSFFFPSSHLSLLCLSSLSI